MCKFVNWLKKAWQWLTSVWTAISSWLRQDGFNHLAVSALFFIALGWIRPMWIPILIVALIGIGKEVYDYVTKKGTPEWHDLACDVIGILFGMFFTWINSL